MTSARDRSDESFRVLVCPDKFRGSLTARQAALHMAEGSAEAGASKVVSLPLADGGEGTLEAICPADSDWHAVDTVDALGRPIVSTWALLPDGTAVIEAANSIGLEILGEERDPLAASSAGVGKMIASALDARPHRLLIAVGGVASTDGGIGCLRELGRDLRGVETVVLCDVNTRYVDAAHVFGPQKGANPTDVRVLTKRLKSLSARFRQDGQDIGNLPGSGAAGGLAGGLAALGAKLGSGFKEVAALVGLEHRLAQTDLVITGEGKLDSSSLQGKVIDGVLDSARRHDRMAAVVAGIADPNVTALLDDRGVVVKTLRALVDSDEDSMTRAGELLRTATADAVRRILN